METRVQPFEQARLSLAEIGIRDADVLKPEFSTLGADPLREPRGIDLRPLSLFSLHALS